jgi:hypothetical protein
MLRCLAVLIVLAAATTGCTAKHDLAKCKGPLIVMNADKWRPSAMEIDALDKICPEEK